MAAVEITISGVMYDKYSRTQQNVVLFGEASITGLQVGGGPVQPPAGGPPGGPVHIWGGGNVPMPSPPIANVPGAPGYQPPGEPPQPISPPVEWKAIWAGEPHGWVVVGIPQFEHPAPA